MGISKKIFLLAALFLSVGLVSCKDWGEMDLPAGNQQKPNLTTLATYTFDGFDANVQAGAYEGGKSPKLVTDPQLEVVLELDGGYLQYPNPVQHVSLQEGMAITGWVKLNKEDNEGAIFSFGNETDKLVFTGDCSLYYKGEKLTTVSQTLTAGEWHWLAVQVMNDGIIINVDGVPVGTVEEPSEEPETAARTAEVSENTVSLEVLEFLTTNASGLYFGYGSETVPTKRWMKQFSVYKNTITESEIAKPELPEIGDGGDVDETPVYENPYILGEQDCSTPWWTEYSPIMKADGDCIFHQKFVNHTNGIGNWNNWTLVISNGKLPDEDGYQEYALVRADNWGWLNGDGNNTIASSSYPLTNTYDTSNDWAKFREEMEGAIVDLTVKRIGSELTMHADIITKSELEWTYDWTYGAIPTGELGVFLTVDNSWLEIDLEEAYVGNAYEQGTNVVGNTDCSTAFWGAHTSKVLVEGDGKVNIQFEVHSSKANVWNYYATVVTTGKHPSEEGYAAADELLLLRNDPFGWGSMWNENNNIVVIDGTDNMVQADGQLVTLTIERKGNMINYDAFFVSNGETIRPYTYQGTNFPEEQEQWAVFLTVDASWLDIISMSTYPFIANIK